MRHISADYIITVSGDPIRNGIVTVDDKGKILEVSGPGSARNKKALVERYEGIITPGFVNCHCHLELSHLQNLIPGGRGLVPFVSEVMSRRDMSEETIISEMKKADKAMLRNGIVAVGDISNLLLSKEIKLGSQLYYHTFVELLGFDPKKADLIFARASRIKDEFAPLRASLAPHAPYSVSRELFSLLKSEGELNAGLTSMHNQESEEENKLFQDRKGAFLRFYFKLNIDISQFQPTGKSSVQSLIPFFSSKQKLLLVHNTFTNAADVELTETAHPDVYWCFCPKANLYIEGRLPQIESFSGRRANITLGTDSLASNDSLCILSEIKLLHKHYSSLSSIDSIQWATLNGARYLGIERQFGSIETGKVPGLNLISKVKGTELTDSSEVKRLI